MLDEAAARSTYLEYLDFEVDWKHRFNDDATSPLSMQIHQGDAVIHLNGRAESEAPVCEVQVPVQGLDQYCEYLCAKDTEYQKPEVVDPRCEGRRTDMNVADPFGNHLVF